MNKKELGNFGENKATEFLERKGYTILERNFFSYKGEIDIIAKDKNEFVFIEVKTRKNIKYGQPVEAVNYYKKNHIVSTTKYYLYKNNLTNVIVRFDIIEVFIKENTIKINHLKNVM